MIISDISVRRPVFAAVISLILIAFGLIAFDRLPLREYPDIDPPVVSVETIYPGAAANVVETRISTHPLLVLKLFIVAPQHLLSRAALPSRSKNALPGLKA